MSRRKTRPDEIRNKKHYFMKYIAEEAKHDRIAQNDYEEINVSLEQMLECGESVVNSKKLLLVAVNENGEQFEEYMAEQSVGAWLDCINNPRLHAALIRLTERQKNILYLRYHHQLSQRETGEILCCSQQCVSSQERSAKRSIKNFLKSGCEKR